MNVVAHNLMGAFANRELDITGTDKKKSSEKLSSGYRINRAADDAAGLAISEKLRWQVRGLNRASVNCKEGIGYVQVGDGALQEVHSMLQRLNELAIQSANGTNTPSDRAAIDDERGQIVSEMERIFTDTSFNEKKIWDPSEVMLKNPPDIEYRTIHNQAVTVDRSGSYYDISDENVGAVPKGDINVHASLDDGLSFSWTGFNGNTYTTGKVDWDTLQRNGYSVKLSDLYPTGSITNGGNPVAGASFYGANGNPLIDKIYSYSPYQKATLEDVVKSLDGTWLDVSRSVPLSAQFEDQSGNKASNKFSIYSESLNFSTAYDSFASKKNSTAAYDNTKETYDFDKGTDASFTPVNRQGVQMHGTSDDYLGAKNTNLSSGNLTTCPDYDNLGVQAAYNDSTSFSFSYEMNGIGRVTADLTDIFYSGGSINDPADENIWWEWDIRKNSKGEEISRRKVGLGYHADSNDMKGLMSTLKGTSSKPGMLRKVLGGKSEYGGDMYLTFTLRGPARNSIGQFKMSTSFLETMTEDSFYQTIKDSLNKDTIVDLFTTDSEEQSNYDLSIRAGSPHYVDVPDQQVSKVTWHYPLEYEADPVQLHIKDGALQSNDLLISYENMSLITLGIAGMDMKTEDSASQAIDLIGKAIDKVSKERAQFGAYQNRLEHTIANIDTTAENSDAAESRIRDTDMSKEMVRYSKDRILEQVGQSMLAQANQQPADVIRLLQ